jgi:hypothetical protein
LSVATEKRIELMACWLKAVREESARGTIAATSSSSGCGAGLYLQHVFL